MSKMSKIFTCTKCDAQFSKWNGRCLECESWGTLKEDLVDVKEGEKKKIKESIQAADIINLETLEEVGEIRLETGMAEVDRVLGGGFVKGSLLLLSGEPGIGKSTILAQIADKVGERDSKTIYVSGEESALQVKSRFERLGCDLENMVFVKETNVEKIVATLKRERPRLVVIDSIQTVYSSLAEGGAGAINQIRASAVSFLELAKNEGICIILVGHITKDGQVAGPKTLEHIVDAVINLETQKNSELRILRAQKNRFGAVSEIGVFEMTSKGFKEIKNPSAVYIEEGVKQSIPGSVVSCVIEGTRPFLVEIQALVSKTVFGYPQRKSSGFDLNRLQVLTSVLTKRAGVNLMNQDVILNVVGGVRVNDPALDLPVCTAIISSLLNFSIGKSVVIFGEVGLGGEIRSVSRLENRVKEAGKLGFKKAIVPSRKLSLKGIDCVQIDGLENLLKIVR